jgi:hypothetical protein
VSARLRARAEAAGAEVAVGWAELLPGDAGPGADALLAAAERALAAARPAPGGPTC